MVAKLVQWDILTVILGKPDLYLYEYSWFASNDNHKYRRRILLNLRINSSAVVLLCWKPCCIPLMTLFLDSSLNFLQSPGRDSPGSSSGSAGSGSRHSTASLDSGRASYHPLSTAGRSTIGSSNSPRCSLSSCSIGSDQGRIERMIHQGVPVSLNFYKADRIDSRNGTEFDIIGRLFVSN